MSLEDVRQVSAANPTLLSANLVSTCYRHTALLIEKLRAGGHDAYHVCKSPGESQYTPPGFALRDVVGLDGKTYRCSGVSPDAIWCDGTIVDTIASCNEHERPIYRRQGDPNWSFDPNDGPQITGMPVWNVVPPSNWRNNNPPLKDGGTSVPLPPPPPPPPPPKPALSYPGDGFFNDKVGAPLQADYASANQMLNAGSAMWIARVVWDIAQGNLSPEASIKKHRNEWRAALGLPPV